jgi:hypothetical protein
MVSINSWHFRLRTALGERMLSRALQILDTQRVPPRLAQLRELSCFTEIDFIVDTDAEKARRIGRLLRRLDRFQAVTWYAISANDAEKAIQRTTTATRVHSRFQPTLDPACDFWRTVASVSMDRDAHGLLVDGHHTEVRLAWNDEHLFVLFLCDYVDLNLRTGTPLLDAATQGLWNNDVAEIFISPGADTPVHYKEFEVSPRAEWISLEIETREDGRPEGAPLHSDARYEAQLDHHLKRWTGMMQISFNSIAPASPTAGMTFRVNLFRSQGPGPVELAWQPTKHRSFHVPSSFGTLILTDE